MSNSSDKNLSAPRWHSDNQYPTEPFAEILPGLYMGGTADDATVDVSMPLQGLGDPNLFDAVVTLYSWAQPMGWGVEEMRYGFADASVEHFDTERLLRVSRWAFDRWNAGEQVLIRCQAGLNRSGLVTALILMSTGLDAETAIDLIRTNRGEHALCNSEYEAWLKSNGQTFLSPASLQEIA